MDDNARLQLQKMIKANNVEDQTQLIRDLKHSSVLRKDIHTLILIKSKYTNATSDPSVMEQLVIEAMSECSFLCSYYTDIYNKIRKDEIDLNILFRFIDILEEIEDGKLDQHEGSFMVGTLLKELYVDSALKKAEKLNNENSEISESKPAEKPLSISWKKFKQMDSKN
jgi:hypothetical protein